MYHYLFIIFLLLLVWRCKPKFVFPERLTISSIDGKVYAVKKNFTDHQRASDILARLNAINQKLITHMAAKYANTSNEDGIAFLSENYNGDVLSEHIPMTVINTSYVLNKGDLIKLCLRSPETGEIHDFQTLLFVNLHELAHLLDYDYGHNTSFWRGFKTILQEAAELGVYTPVDYSKFPTRYCGLTITSNPYFNPDNPGL